jgi:hypothetical protein
MKRRTCIAAAAVLATTSLAVPLATMAPFAGAAPPWLSAAKTAGAANDDTREAGFQVLSGTLPVEGLDVSIGDQMPSGKAAERAAAAAPEPTVGEVRSWLGLDEVGGFYYPKKFTLKAVRNNVEIWAASEVNQRAPSRASLPQVGQSSGLAFLDGDCRNGIRTEITDTQANYLADEFQTNIYPKMSEVFSVAPDRAGATPIAGPPTFAPAGPGQRTVVLVDNVRDGNFYDLNNTGATSFIAGFFSSQLNGLFDRNVMTIDGFDWLHRTGANPPNEPVPGNSCTSAPARPFNYEGVFAHEYQHLLHSYSDPDETTWINEGLSDWAETLTGYLDPSKPVTEIGFDSHTQCFLGFLSQLTAANPNPRLRSGPENSLTRWGDQSDAEILCDYGAVYTFAEMVAGRYGPPFMTALHRGDANGIAAVQQALDVTGNKKERAQDVIHDWALMVAVDGLLDEGARLRGPYRRSDLSTPTLNARINWDTPEAYSSPGAPSNGSDYVRLRNRNGRYLTGRDITSLSFKGATTLPTRPVQWTVDPNPPTGATGAALAAGAADNRDEAIVREITVPAGAAASLTFDAAWNQEVGWDFGFAQVSSDGGSTYQSLTCTDSVLVANPEAIPLVTSNLPGFTGDSAGFKPQTCSLAAFAGTTVLLAFRAINDPATLGENPEAKPGFWIDNVKVGGTAVGDDTLTGWKSFTETKPTSVAGFFVNIISIEGRVQVRNAAGAASENSTSAADADGVSEAVTSETASEEFDVQSDSSLWRPGQKASRIAKDGSDAVTPNDAERQSEDRAEAEDRGAGRGGPKVTIRRIPLTADFAIKGRYSVERFIPRNADFVAAVVTYDDPTEGVTQYAPYQLIVNGVTQPGGS